MFTKSTAYLVRVEFDFDIKKTNRGDDGVTAPESIQQRESITKSCSAFKPVW